jgi:hypothetical protein
MGLGFVGVLAVIPALVWFSRRYVDSPPGRYPIMDKFYKNAWFRLVCVLVMVVVLNMLLSIKQLTR